MKTKIFLALLLAPFFSCFPKQVMAQQLSLEITPSLVEIIAKPGKSVTQAFEVSNKSERDLYLTANVFPFSAQGSEGRINLDLNSQECWQMPCGEVFSLENSDIDLNETFLIKSGESRQLVLKVVMPERILNDGYFTLLVSQSLEGNFMNTSGIGGAGAIGANILVTISEDGINRSKIIIDEFSTDKKVVDIFDRLLFKGVVVNQGSSFGKINGEIHINNVLGNDKIILNLRQDNVLADSKRQFVCQTEAQGEIKTQDCSFSSGLPGIFTAKLILDGREEEAETLRFVVFPTKIFIACLVAGAFVYFLRKRSSQD